MISTALFLGLVLFSVPGMDLTYPPNSTETATTFCNHELCIETFATSFYTAMVVEHGFDVVAGVEVPGIDAAKTEYNVVMQILQEQGLCDAEWVAFTASTPFAKLDNVSLSVYLEKTGHSVGTFLNDTGLLECSTAIPVALKFFNLVCNAFSGDENQLGSYMHGVVQGLVDLINEYGLDLDNSANKLAYLFDKQFRSNKNNCSKSKN